MASSKALPIALWLSCISCIWSYMPDWVLCMVSCISRIDSIVEIIGGIRVRIWAVSTANWSRLGISAWKSSVIVSMPSRVSKTDRIDQQTGMSKQCGSQ